MSLRSATGDAQRLRRAARAGAAKPKHRDKYVGLAAPAHPALPQPVLTPERAVAVRRLSADAENEEILRSLPGGTPNERVESAHRGLHMNQEAFASARKEDH